MKRSTSPPTDPALFMKAGAPVLTEKQYLVVTVRAHPANWSPIGSVTINAT